MFQEIGGFQTEPVTYTALNSRNYTEGVYSFAKPMPLISGLYNYNMRVSPGDLSFQQTINIGKSFFKVNHNSLVRKFIQIKISDYSGVGGSHLTFTASLLLSLVLEYISIDIHPVLIFPASMKKVESLYMVSLNFC